MTNEERDRGTVETIKDATGMDTSNDVPAMTSGDERTTDAQLAGDEDAQRAQQPEADGGEKTEIEGMAGLGATNRAFGGRPPQVQGGIGTDVPAADEEKEGSLDPRGY